MDTPTLDTAAAASVVPGGPARRSPQGPVYAPGISRQTVGARALFLGLVTLPPGERTRAHIHEQHESAFYMLSGNELEVFSGEALDHRCVCRPGDFLFIPAGVPHVAVNRSTTEPAVLVGARNEATATESLVMTPGLDRRVA